MYAEHVRRSRCGTRCSGVDPELGLVVRAWVECPECLAQPDGSSVLQAVLEAIKGTIDPSTQIADHPNVKFAQMQRLRWMAMPPIALREELGTYLDGLVITGDTIGDIRRRLFMPWDSAWNAYVRDETAKRERTATPGEANP
jgi:hypothetical protein